MSLGRYALGAIFVGLTFVPIVTGVRRLRRAVIPQLRGAIAVLAEIVVVLTTTVVLSELLGTVGLFRVGPFIVAMLVAGLCIAVIANRCAARPAVEVEVESDPESRLARAGDLAVIADPSVWRP